MLVDAGTGATSYEVAAGTRRRLLDRIATDRLLVQGFHLPFSGVGHAVRDGSAYRWLP